LPLVSAAVTLHFLAGALTVSQLPRLHAHLGIASVTRLAGGALGTGVLGWALAAEPWQLFAAALLSGAGWGGTSAAAVNAILAPWFVRGRTRALSLAYNGASVGGIVMQPLWVIGIQMLGYPVAAGLIAATTVLVIWLLAGFWFARAPEDLGQRADGDPAGTAAAVLAKAWVVPLPGPALYRNWQFRTLSAGMTLGLFAQTGLLVHLFSHLVPALGPVAAGWLVTASTIAAMAGRTVLGATMPVAADRRIATAVTFLIQVAGSLVLLLAEGTQAPLLIAGALLFGIGVGNGISLPPLIAQVEFAKEDVPRVVAAIVATSQATYAFAPAVFSLLTEAGTLVGAQSPSAPLLFIGAAVMQALGIVAFLAGRRR
jgi:MFS family permease